MRPYRYITYGLQMGTVAALFLSFFLRWHTGQGTGYAVLYQAWETRVVMGFFSPENIHHVPLSHWWLVWIIPLVAVAMLVRAIGGLMLPIPDERPLITRGLLVFMGLIFGWYALNFWDGLQVGFWLSLMSASLLSVLVVVEQTMPEKSPTQQRLDNLPASHPERLMEGYYRVCPACGEFNTPDAKLCVDCGSRLPIVN